MNKKILFVAILIFLAMVFAAFYFYKPAATNITGLDNFAKCLASKNITMYGAAWCAHCQDQKNLFGDSFKYVSYVECPDEPQKCLNEGITGYPTWIFPDKRKLIGEQGLEKLSQESGCPLPLE
jgi:glutaredoxin